VAPFEAYCAWSNLQSSCARAQSTEPHSKGVDVRVEEDFYSVDEVAKILKLTPGAYARCSAPASSRASRRKRAAAAAGRYPSTPYTTGTGPTG
jgi:hypothetical protein